MEQITEEKYYGRYVHIYIYIRQENFYNNDCYDETGLEFNYTETYTSFHPLFHPKTSFRNWGKFPSRFGK